MRSDPRIHVARKITDKIRITGNQRDKLLAALRNAPQSAAQHPGGASRWLSIPDILRLGIAQYGARIYELRRAGHVIENFLEWSDADGCSHSWFRLVSSPPLAPRKMAAHEKEK